MSRLFGLNSVAGLPNVETEMLVELIEVLNDKENNNAKRMLYYKSKNDMIDLGIAIPPCLKNLRGSVGWASKAVDTLAVRSRFEGFYFADGDDHGINNIFNTNSFKSAYQQMVTSELINSCAFVTLSKGGAGEPPVIINVYSALNASAVWDWRKKRIKYALVVADRKKRKTTEEYIPTAVNLYTENDIWEIERDGGAITGAWRATRKPHKMGRPLIEALVYRPTIDRPFGRSRITRDVMEIIDNATRESVRTEIHSEFFTSPQRVILGADPATLFENKSQQEAYLGSFLALTTDEEGNTPQVTQFAQASMQPHIDYMKSLAMRFSAITNVPVSEMGIVSDNPSSAEAILAAKEGLVLEAEDLNASNGEALKNIGKMAMATLNNKSFIELNEVENSITPRFRNPATPSVVSQSDAMTKQAASAREDSWFTGTRIFWEQLGYEQEQVDRILNDRDEAMRKTTLSTIANALTTPTGGEIEQ